MTKLWLDFQEEQEALKSVPYTSVPGYNLQLEFIERYVIP